MSMLIRELIDELAQCEMNTEVDVQISTKDDIEVFDFECHFRSFIYNSKDGRLNLKVDLRDRYFVDEKEYEDLIARNEELEELLEELSEQEANK